MRPRNIDVRRVEASIIRRSFFFWIVRNTVETRVSINAAMIPTQKSAFAIFASTE